MTTQIYQGIKFNADLASKVEDVLSVEEALQININDAPFTITMRTPGNDAELVRGLLHSENVLKNHLIHPKMNFRKEEKEDALITVNLNLSPEELGAGYSNSRNLLSVASCGICGKTELEDVLAQSATLRSEHLLKASDIPSMYHKMQEVQTAFLQSGGSHAAAAFDKKGNLLSIMEDIGRHNAVDKVVGDLLLRENLMLAKALLVSGRISYEIVVKAFKARIPILCAVSAPSSLAVDFAKELGITLLAFCRGDRATCYAHPERIQTTYQSHQAG